jgi:hypothetical protein
MNIETLKDDLDRGKNLSDRNAVWNHRENPEGILITIAKLCTENPGKAFSTKEIKEEYKKGMEAEINEFMDTHEKWNPVSFFAQQETEEKMPEKSREVLQRWYNLLERRHVEGYYHYTLPEEVRGELENYFE